MYVYDQLPTDFMSNADHV
jgi:EKC/KEOPS complex subunit CGI121/TPRKB